MQKGWVYEPVISNYDALLFYNVMSNYTDGYHYHPIAIAKREQIGMKYRFLCIVLEKITLNLPSHFADIEIYKPELGKPYATCIYKLEFEQFSSQRI